MTAYLTTKAAAAYLSISPTTFRRAIAALPATKRPQPIKLPGVKVQRWRASDLDSAFAGASASKSWDQALEAHHVTTTKTKRGKGR